MSGIVLYSLPKSYGSLPLNLAVLDLKQVGQGFLGCGPAPRDHRNVPGGDKPGFRDADRGPRDAAMAWSLFAQAPPQIDGAAREELQL
jgi:hypothetical protein